MFKREWYILLDCSRQIGRIPIAAAEISTLNVQLSFGTLLCIFAQCPKRTSTIGSLSPYYSKQSGTFCWLLKADWYIAYCCCRKMLFSMYSPAFEQCSIPFTLPPNVLVGMYLSSVYLDFFPLNPRLCSVCIGMDAHWLSIRDTWSERPPPFSIPNLRRMDIWRLRMLWRMIQNVLK